jgi:hypothetical protein
MKLKVIFLIMLMFIGFTVFSQTDPGTANLKHRWTFDNGSLTDEVGGVVGTIIGTGSLVNNGFVATNAYMNIPAAEIGINAYPALSIEVWCTSAAGKNGGWTMLTYFGETVGTGGRNCTFLSIARGDNVSMATLETSVWNGATGPEYDDGKLHHFVYTVDQSTISLYIDGQFINSGALTAGNTLANVSTSLGYLGRGGWTADPNWIGTYHKFSIYNKSLTSDEILFLYREGAEKQAVINATATSIAFDNHYPYESFNITGANLTQPISVTTPAGITLTDFAGNTITSLPSNATDVEVVAVWNSEIPVDGEIVLTSGSASTKIQVKSASDKECYNMLYTDISNYVEDPGLNNIAKFKGGWGATSVSNILNDPANVYCGASSIKIGDGINTGSGSLNFELTGLIAENTTYRVKVMLKTIGGSFQLGLLGWDATQGDLNFKIDTKGEWMALDTTFTTGATMGPTQWMFINNWQCTGVLAYADNWEFYLLPDPVINVSPKAVAFDPEHSSSDIFVSGLNLMENIVITPPAGISANPAQLNAETSNETVTLQWDGITPVDGALKLVSGTKTVQVAVKTTSVSNNSCFTPLYSDKVNLIPDPFTNKPALFAGWGAKSIINIAEYPDSVYCGSHSGRINGQGSLDVSLVGIVKPNTHYKAKAMVRTFGGYFQLGVFGIDNLVNTDVADSIDTQGAWMPITVEFTTAELSANHGLFFNNYKRTGKRGFVDNWELYETDPNSTPEVNESKIKLFVNNRKIMAEFAAETTSMVEFNVYNVAGVLISSDKLYTTAGKSVYTLSAETGSGVYIVQVYTNGQNFSTRVVK